MKETSVSSHSTLLVPSLNNEPYVQSSGVFLIYILSPQIESRMCSTDASMSKWMNWPFNYPGILGSKLTCSGHLFTTVSHQCLVCVYKFHASFLLYTFVLKGRTKKEN